MVWKAPVIVFTPLAALTGAAWMASYDVAAGSPTPYRVFRPHALTPLEFTAFSTIETALSDTATWVTEFPMAVPPPYCGIPMVVSYAVVVRRARFPYAFTPTHFM